MKLPIPFFAKICSIILPTFLSAQSYNLVTENLAFNNPAFSINTDFMRRGYIASELLVNAGFSSFTNTNYASIQSGLRYQLAFNKWSVGFQQQNSWINNASFSSTNSGFNVWRRFNLNRYWKLNTGIGYQNQRTSYFQDFILVKPLNSYLVGVQLRYKTWQFSNSYLLSMDPLKWTLGLQKSIQLDSLSSLTPSFYFAMQNGFTEILTNLHFQRAQHQLMLGSNFKNITVAYGRQLPMKKSASSQRVLLSLSISDPSKLSNYLGFGAQLHYQLQLKHRSNFQHFTGTPSF
ncbi:MAG: hypothetical protein RLZZ301_1097 [Bacteroidota bacterium]|jgi:hypothetical protein